MQLHGTRNNCPVVGEYQITDSDQRFVHLHSPVRALQIPPFSERQAFALHIRVSRFSGLLGPRNGTVAPLRRRCAGLGEAIWRDFGRHGIAEIHPDFCRRRSCIKILAIFLRAKECLLPGYGIQQPGWWLPRMTAAIAHSTALSFWALCSPVHYKTPTTRDMTEMSGTP